MSKRSEYEEEKQTLERDLKKYMRCLLKQWSW